MLAAPRNLRKSLEEHQATLKRLCQRRTAAGPDMAEAPADNSFKCPAGRSPALLTHTQACDPTSDHSHRDTEPSAGEGCRAAGDNSGEGPSDTGRSWVPSAYILTWSLTLARVGFCYLQLSLVRRPLLYAEVVVEASDCPLGSV